MSQQEMMQLSEQMEGLENAREQLENQTEVLREEIADIDSAIDTLEALQQDDEVLIELAESVRLRATVESVDEVVVNIGADLAAELDEETAVDVLERKKEEMAEKIEEAEEEIESVEEKISEVEAQATALQNSDE